MTQPNADNSKMRLTIAALALCIGILGAPPLAPANSGKPSSRCTLGSYRLVESRASVRVIFVEPACDNLESMKALGDRLRTDFAAESIIIGMIFDNLRAAQMYDRMLDAGGSLGAREDSFYDKHNIGNYSKNVNTGFHQYIIMLQGGNGHQIEIDY